MIVIAAGMSRSGSTLQYQLIRELVESKHLGEGRGPWHIDKQLPAKYDEKFYIYKSERALPGALDKIYRSFAIIRNPLDVAISLYRYRLAKEYHEFTGYPTDIADTVLIELQAVMTWIEFWEKNGASIIRYEDLYPDSFTEIVKQAAHHLDIEIEDGDAIKMVSKFTIEKNLKRLRSLEKWFDNTESMLTLAHISPNNGAPGEGRKHLSDEHIAIIEDYAGDFMERYGYL